MTHLREHWEGVSLAENYTLEAWLAGDESTALFQTSKAPEGRALVKLVPQTTGDGAALLDLWHRTRQLRHPNLIQLLDFGSAEHCGEIVYYAVFESPDETLASALSRATLNSQESREVLDAVLDALRYLHAQGLVLGALDADHIVAVGDRIKLSTDAIREAETSAAYREDVRLLGDLWQQALMPASPRSEEIAAHAADRNPQTRWTLAEIHAALNPPIAGMPATAPPPTASAPVSEQPTGESPVSMPPAVVGNDEASLPRSHRRTPEAVLVFRFPRWILVGTGGFLLLIFALNRPWRADVATERRVAPFPATAEVPPAASFPNAPHATAPNPSRPAGKAIWRVIAFTYRTREAAAKKVEQLNRVHPGLNASVFSPKGQRGYYLVSLGGRMTREDAVRLQRSARGKGLPRDLYVQNYSE
jgi:hypothetical protein